MQAISRTTKSRNFSHSGLVILSLFLGVISALFFQGDRAAGEEPGELLSNTAVAVEDGDSLELVSHLGGTVTAVAASGNLVFIGIGPELSLLDISNPAQPTRIGYLVLPDVIEDIHTAGDYVFVAAGWAGLRVVDVNDPSTPREIGHAITSGFARRLSGEGSNIYIAAEGTGLFEVNIADPSTPYIAGSVDTPGTAVSVHVENGYAYVADNQEGLRIFDVSVEGNPQEIGSYDTLGLAKDLAVQGKRVFIANDDRGVSVVGIADPTNPVLRGYFTTPGNALGISVAGEYVYVADGSAGLRVFVYREEDPPIEVGKYDTEEPANRMVLHRNFALLVDGGLQIIQVVSPETPKFKGVYEAPRLPVSSAPAGGHLYTADTSFGLRVVAVSNPENPVLVSTLDTPSFAQDIIVREGLAFLLDWEDLRIFDLNNPATPIEVGVYSGSYTGRGLDVAGDHAYIADDEYGIWIVDVHDPRNPTGVGYYDTPGYANDITVSGNYAYVADWIEGLLVLDISNPKNPRYVGHRASPGEALGGDISGSYYYLADGDGGIRLINVSDPADPVEDGYALTLGMAKDLVVRGELAVVADGEAGVTLVNVSDPDEPLVVANYDTPGSAEHVAISDELIYVSDAWGGIFILRLNSHIIEGYVLQANGAPYPGLTITLQTGMTTTTSSNGLYAFNGLAANTYTLTPDSGVYTTQPHKQSVTLPPNAYGINFTILPKPVSITLTPGYSSTLIYTDTQGLPTQFKFPSSTVITTTTITLTPTTAIADPGLAFAGHAFEITPLLVFSSPVTVTIQYSLADVNVIRDTNELDLYWWSQDNWQKAIKSCNPVSDYTHDTEQKVMEIPVCRSGKFALFGPTYAVFFPTLFVK